MENKLEYIKSCIERMSKKQHVDVLRIIKFNSSTRINENRNGIYINMSYIPDSTIVVLEKYIQYVNDQEKSLEPFEMQKEEFKNILKECHII
jgi:hypothetical protein